LHLTETIEEETRIPYLDLEVAALTREFDTGTVVIELTQPAGNLIPLILEPHSTYSICSESSGRKYKFDHYLLENEEYPIYRLIKKIGNH
jgi:hypothetical protein